mmetsp:Transcript_11352/g.38722  ORF Transcript_11352/g.38722 Transcript_11352/m.38722 type:complete len:260 (+) Transcript_11352:158-937(+)
MRMRAAHAQGAEPRRIAIGRVNPLEPCRTRALRQPRAAGWMCLLGAGHRRTAQRASYELGALHRRAPQTSSSTLKKAAATPRPSAVHAPITPLARADMGKMTDATATPRLKPRPPSTAQMARVRARGLARAARMSSSLRSGCPLLYTTPLATRKPRAIAVDAIVGMASAMAPTRPNRMAMFVPNSLLGTSKNWRSHGGRYSLKGFRGRARWALSQAPSTVFAMSPAIRRRSRSSRIRSLDTSRRMSCFLSPADLSQRRS